MSAQLVYRGRGNRQLPEPTTLTDAQVKQVFHNIHEGDMVTVIDAPCPNHTWCPVSNEVTAGQRGYVFQLDKRTGVASMFVGENDEAIHSLVYSMHRQPLFGRAVIADPDSWRRVHTYYLLPDGYDLRLQMTATPAAQSLSSSLWKQR